MSEPRALTPEQEALRAGIITKAGVELLRRVPWSRAIGDREMESMVAAIEDEAASMALGDAARDRLDVALGIIVGLAFDARGVKHTKAELLTYLEVVENEGRKALTEAQQREGAGSCPECERLGVLCGEHTKYAAQQRTGKEE